LVQNPGYSVEVQGHTDSKGSDEYNIKLSERRANEAKTYLVSKGIEETRVIAIGFGEGAPIAPNDVQGDDDPEGRARNRRVEFKLLPDKPEEAPEIEYDPNVPVDETKTGPGYDKK
jgi:outer membrane protein OmpA-like peptidoglycan-associated protein